MNKKCAVEITKQRFLCALCIRRRHLVVLLCANACACACVFISVFVYSFCYRPCSLIPMTWMDEWITSACIKLSAFTWRCYHGEASSCVVVSYGSSQQKHLVHWIDKIQWQLSCTAQTALYCRQLVTSWETSASGWAIILNLSASGAV